MSNNLRVQLEDVNGNKLAPSFGYIETVSNVQSTATMDMAGKFSFTMSAKDRQVNLLQNEVLARIFARIRLPQARQYRWVEVSLGPINFIDEEFGRSDRINVGGDDIMRELTYFSVHKLKLADEGSYVPVATALSTLSGYAPIGWSIAYDPTDIISAPYPQTYARFNGETTLAALGMVTRKAGCHFFRGTGKQVLVRTSFADSEVFAQQGEARLNTATILDLSRRSESYDIYTRIYPVGTGNGDIEITLRSTTRSFPPGSPYVLNKADNYIERIDTPYGTRQRRVEFREIGPIDNTDSDMETAANALFDAALQELEWHSGNIMEPVYDVVLGNCDQLLHPMQSLNLRWNKGRENINGPLNILEARWGLSESGQMQTTGLVVTTSNRWPRMSGDDDQTVSNAITLGKVFRAIPQGNGIGYWMPHTVFVGQDQDDHYAEMPIIFGRETQTIQRIYLRYKVEQVVGYTSLSLGKVDVELAVSLTGTVTLPGHTHPVSAHQHPISIVNVAAGWPTLHLYTSGFTAIGALGASATIQTDSGGGATTATSGGSGPVDLTGDATGAVDMSEAVRPYFTMTKMSVLDTFEMDDLEVSVNGSDYVGLETGLAKGDGYYEIELSSHATFGPTLVNPDKQYRPVNENNRVVIRRKTGVAEAAIDNINNGSVLTLVPHGLGVGQTIVITGNGTYDGVYIVEDIVSDTLFNLSTALTGLDAGGLVTIVKMAQIKVMIGIFNTVASLAYQD